MLCCRQTSSFPGLSEWGTAARPASMSAEWRDCAVGRDPPRSRSNPHGVGWADPGGVYYFPSEPGTSREYG